MTDLTPEERFLWDCASRWRSQDFVVDVGQLDWPRLVEIAIKNRMASLLDRVLRERGLINVLEPIAAAKLEEGVGRNVRRAERLAPDLCEYLRRASTINQDVVVIKGLWLCEKIYGDINMRPGADIDLLLRKEDIPESLRILEDEMGYGSWWKPLLNDKFYARHHLHQQRCNADRSIWIEPHWLLDHPYTLLTVDYDKLMDRTTKANFLGERVNEMATQDLLISLVIHLVKHAVYLPSLFDRSDIQRLILADGFLMYFIDVSETVKHYQEEIDWHQTVALAHESGATQIFGSVLSVCQRYLSTPVPDYVLANLNEKGTGRITRKVMGQLAEYQIKTYTGQETSRLWSLLLDYNESIIFRPIRLLDLVKYLLPGQEFLYRYYGNGSPFMALMHFFTACVEYIRIGVDTLYYTLRRKIETKVLDYQGFVWPGPPQEI